MTERIEKPFLPLLVFFASATAGVGWLFGLASELEAISFITGALCVWLTVLQSAWNFPLSLLSVVSFFFVFVDAKLYADAGLQVVYFALTLVGWYLWLFGGTQRTALKVSKATRTELLSLIVFVALATAILREGLSLIGGSASFWDALTTSISLAAQWLLNRKKLETWWFWVTVDVIYIPLYLYKSLYLTAILYFVFLCMVVIGFKEWRREV